YSNDAHPNYQDLWPGIISASTSRCFCRHQSPRAHSFSASEEIAGLNLSQVELVVLSACETARGVDIAGEGSFGLRRTFLMAGARAVVAGLWRVNDLATKDLMLKFYDLLWHDHLPKAEALRRSQVYMIEKGRSENGQDSARPLPQYAPYYWAAFVTSGDWK
ncbi:MAG: CHAT domain-containing protein, partial [Methylocystis sp.]